MICARCEHILECQRVDVLRAKCNDFVVWSFEVKELLGFQEDLVRGFRPEACP